MASTSLSHTMPLLVGMMTPTWGMGVPRQTKGGLKLQSPSHLMLLSLESLFKPMSGHVGISRRAEAEARSSLIGLINSGMCLASNRSAA